jgi:excinuclease ABC subunit A
MDLVKTADWILDLGPEGGKGGGEILFAGTPEQLIKKKSPTAQSLAPYFHPKAKKPPPALPTTAKPPCPAIVIEGACQNNLKGVSTTIPRGQITLCTGPSGSGKSSFAFETVYAEGQRRYVESMSAYARQFVKQLPKPQVERIEGISAAIAIEQKSHAGNPRSTVGTMTESYDYLRLLFAHLGIAHCPETGEPLQTISKASIVRRLLEHPLGTKVQILSPVTLKRQESFEQLKNRLQSLGFLKVRLDGTYYELDGEIPFDRQRKHSLFLVIDRLFLSKEEGRRLLDAIDQATTLSGGSCVAALEGEDLFFHLSFTSLKTGKSYPPITPHTFSFNTESGMCPDCEGLGFLYGIDLLSQEEILELTPLQLIRLLWKEHLSKEALEAFLNVLKSAKIPPREPLEELTEAQRQLLFNGVGASLLGSLQWRGLNPVIASLARSKQPKIKEALLPFFEEHTCPACKGTRLKPLARSVLIHSLSIADLSSLPIDEALPFLETLSPEESFLEEPLKQLKGRLELLQRIGLGYLSLERSAPTLSGGETQRIRLSRQLGSGLTGCLYVLDEPTIGLHPSDNEKLNAALKHLVSLNNTLLLVEHDPLTIQLADKIIDFGPRSGIHGGSIVAEGTLEEILRNPHSLTGAYLSGRKKIPIPSTRRISSDFLTLSHANIHNLQDLHLQIPINAITALSGVSGSGKSTLLEDLIKPAAELGLKNTRGRKKGLATTTHRGATLKGMDHFYQILSLTQDPLGGTNRADVSTYVDLLTPLRQLFASLPESATRGLSSAHFSFNHKRGMCSACSGLGARLISLQFLPPVKVLCEHCQGFRLNPLSLKVSWSGKHLGHILQMSVDEALPFLPHHPKLIRILETLQAVGLGYLQLGQEIATLSGGEAQRLRLSRELSKRTQGATLYLLDEPTVGLHADDIAKLLCVFQALVEKGHTLILIEHNLDVLASADYLIDIGPGSGPSGGRIVAQGTPEEIACHPHSRTAPYLKKHLGI